MEDTNITDAGDNTNNSNEMARQSESPARTIDSHDSTVDSMDTIVDRNVDRQQLLQAAIEQSTNTTNAQQQHDSLTNSQKSILHHNSSSSDDEQQQRLSMQQQQQQQQLQQQEQQKQQQLHADAQSHIYSSPVYDHKPPLKLTAATLVANVVASSNGNGKTNDDAKKPKLISHEEFQQQLQAAAAARADTLDSRISKKQRFPPELIKIKDGDGSSSAAHSTRAKQKRRSALSSAACCSAFPLQIVLGTLQLALAVSLVALGSLLIVREASLSTAGCGIWTGLIAAITGSLGVVSIRKTQTAFLALSLVCIATSTLALAVSGVGLSRDINRSKEKFDLLNANSEISAASGLIFTLFLHFVVSIVSVYRCALQMCARTSNNDLRDIIVSPNTAGLALDQEKVEQYIKAMSLNGSEKDNNEKLAAMWMYATQMGSTRNLTTTAGSRPIMLIPAGSSTMLASPPAPPAAMVMPAVPYRGGMAFTLPYMRPGSVIYPHPVSVPGTHRTQRSLKSTTGHGGPQRRRRLGPAPLRSGKMDANRRQRRKSDADIVDGEAFQYTGLDRTIADNFLARQEQSNSQPGSHIDYSSSSSASDTYGQAASRASSKTKIVCRDVVM